MLVVEHEADAAVQRVGKVLVADGAELDIVGPEAELPFPESLAGYDALVVLGGSPGPEDDERAPWMPRVRALVREALDTGLPYLGICLGAQILSVEAGGTVEKVTSRCVVEFLDTVRVSCSDYAAVSSGMDTSSVWAVSSVMECSLK